MRFTMPKIQITRVDPKEIDFVPKRHKDFLTDITSLFTIIRKTSYRIDYYHGRVRELEQLFTCLMLSTNNNVFLVGDHGVGKKSIVFSAVNKMLDGECPKPIEDIHIISLETERVISIVKSEDQKEINKVSRLFKFLTNTDDEIILFIDQIHLLLNSSYLSFQLFKLLRKRNTKVVGTLTDEDLYGFYYNDESMLSFVNIISVEEPQYSDIFDMISENVALTALSHGVTVSDDIIRYAIALSEIFPSELSCPGNILKNHEKAMIVAKCEMHEAVTHDDVKHIFDFDFDLFNGIGDDEKKLTAYHEAGHFITCKMSEYVRNLDAKIITIIPTDYFLGVTSFDYDLKKQVHSDIDYFIDLIACDLGGKVAEEILLGENFKPSSSASADLQNAIQTARTIVTIYGMTSSSGNTIDFCGIDSLDYSLLTEKRKKEIEAEVQDIIQKAYTRAKAILHQESQLLEVIAEELLRKEVLDEYALDRICSEVHNN